jgi:hypothetical protein
MLGITHRFLYIPVRVHGTRHGAFELIPDLFTGLGMIYP